MSNMLKLISTLLLSMLVLIGCGGGGDGTGGLGQGNNAGSGGGETTTPDEDPEEGGTSNVSYVPLSVFEALAAFSGQASDGVFLTNTTSPYIEELVINPINATSLASIDNAVVEDFVIKVDDIDIDPREGFPLLQRVIGTPTSLNTALVFDVSGSLDGIDFDALVAEAKNYVATAQSSPNEVIANQEFVVWAFARDVVELTSGFTSNTADINAAIDSVATIRTAGTLGTTSNLHKAVLAAVGRYDDPGNGLPFGSDGDNDLVDEAYADEILLSQLVVFSAGPDTSLEVTQDLMGNAIESQSFISYDPSDASAEGVLLKKPVFYFVVGGAVDGEAYNFLSENSETTTFLSDTGSGYSFADDLIADQLEAIDRRIDLDNYHLFRMAFVPRVGDHVRTFASDSVGFNYTLSRTYTAASLLPNAGLGTPAEELATLVEITGPNGEYLALNTASLAEVNTFGFATRWVNEEYDAADYAWSIASGTATLTVNADGTATISNKTVGVDVVLRLENTILTDERFLLIVD
jgi:hypothetical protein